METVLSDDELRRVTASDSRSFGPFAKPTLVVNGVLDEMIPVTRPRARRLCLSVSK